MVAFAEIAETGKIILCFKVKILVTLQAAMTEGWPGSIIINHVLIRVVAVDGNWLS